MTYPLSPHFLPRRSTTLVVPAVIRGDGLKDCWNRVRVESIYSSPFYSDPSLSWISWSWAPRRHRHPRKCSERLLESTSRPGHIQLTFLLRPFLMLDFLVLGSSSLSPSSPSSSSHSSKSWEIFEQERGMFK